jgi:hypothetical protein
LPPIPPAGGYSLLLVHGELPDAGRAHPPVCESKSKQSIFAGVDELGMHEARSFESMQAGSEVAG